MQKTKIDKKKIGIKYPEEVVRPVKEHLLSKLFGLEKKKKQLVEEDPFSDKSRLDDNAASDADAAERVGHMQVSAIRQTIDRSMIQVRKALSQIKVGRYGVCENCGKMIDTDRLVVMPETTICVSCEKKKEK
jgi:RNA polymerase-binding transcription factor DksA